MPTFKTVALSLAAVLISAVSVQAAPHHKKPVHHAAPHAMRHSTGGHGSAATRGGMNADRSADALNAQSLSRAQSPTP